MSFFSGLLKRKKKNNGSNQFENIKIYIDLNLKTYYKQIIIDQSTFCSQLINQLKSQIQSNREEKNNEVNWGEFLIFEQKSYVLFLVVSAKDKREKQIISQRRLDGTEQISKLLQHFSQLFDHYFVYMERTEKLSMQYHINQESKYNAIRGCNAQINIFRKRIRKSLIDLGSYQKKEKMVNSMLDSLNQSRIVQFIVKKINRVYIFILFKKKKIDKKSYISLESLGIEKVDKEKYIFQLKLDQKVYTLQAKSKTDYEGWIYSINKQSMQIKEANLFTDSDKKINLIQKSKLDAYKNLASNVSLGLKMLISTSPQILNELIKFIEKNGDSIDKLLIKLIKLAYEVNFNKQINQFNAKQVREKHRNSQKTLDKVQTVTEILFFFKEQHSVLKQNLDLNQNESKLQVFKFVQFLIEKKKSDWEQLLMIAMKTFTNLSDEDYQASFNTLIPAGLNYFEITHYAQFKSSGRLNYIIANLPSKKFKNFMKFPLPNFSLFWHDIYENSKNQMYQKGAILQSHNGNFLNRNPAIFSSAMMPTSKNGQYDNEIFSPKNQFGYAEQ